MDRFSYNYLTINGEKSNQLDYVHDSGTDYASYDDIKTGQTSGNYQYNKIGELIVDESEAMELEWRYGDHKLRSIIRTDTDGNSSDVSFVYNPLGLRVAKVERPRSNGTPAPASDWKVTYYTYDANNQVMGIYTSNLFADTKQTLLKEQYIYGMKRVGAIHTDLEVFGDNEAMWPTDEVYTQNLGKKVFELTNHLGTVNTTISDRKTWNVTDGHYESVITSYAETYPFGMLMPNRSFNADNQRYGFHGMEQDPELKGAGNSYTTEFRQYDPRLGRWKSIDPLMSMFPHLSPYVGFDNNPIYFVDPYGLSSEDPDGGGDGNDGGGNGDHVRWESSSSYESSSENRFWNPDGDPPQKEPYLKSHQATKFDYNSFTEDGYGAGWILKFGANVGIGVWNNLGSMGDAIGNYVVDSYNDGVTDATMSRFSEFSHSYHKWDPVQEVADNYDNPIYWVRGLEGALSTIATGSLLSFPVASSSLTFSTTISTSRYASNFNAFNQYLSAAKGSGNAFRYVSQGEIGAIKNTGLLRGGRAGETYFTKDLYKSGLKAQQRLSLGSTPTHRIEFQILNRPTLLRNGTKVTPIPGQPGLGSEFMTLDPVRIRLINVQPLR